jgi:hypothetical protein
MSSSDSTMKAQLKTTTDWFDDRDKAEQTLTDIKVLQYLHQNVHSGIHMRSDVSPN